MTDALHLSRHEAAVEAASLARRLNQQADIVTDRYEWAYSVGFHGPAQRALEDAAEHYDELLGEVFGVAIALGGPLADQPLWRSFPYVSWDIRRHILPGLDDGRRVEAAIAAVPLRTIRVH